MGWLAAHHMHPTSTNHHVTSAKRKKSNPWSVTATNGAALHCIRSTSCHPSPPGHKARQGTDGAMQCEGRFTASRLVERPQSHAQGVCICDKQEQ